MAMALLLLWSGCTGEVLTEENPVRVESERAIVFDDGFVDNNVQTRAAITTPLSQHHVTMGVWGWETDPAGEENLLFVNQLVKFEGDSVDVHNWTYNPQKYWNESNLYRFYAYAPHDAMRASIDAVTGRVSIQNIVLTGANLQQPASHTIKDNFSMSADTDWMVARGGQSVPGTYRYKVNFNMKHILAKFMAAVRLGSALVNDPDNPQVTITQLTIGNFASKGSFAQQFDHTPNPEDVTEMSVPEWTLDASAAPYALSTASAATATAAPIYLLESLLLPQEVGDDIVAKLSYTISYQDGRSERFVHTLSLKEAFSRFCGGCCYTITFTINPRVISFDSGICNWEAEYESETMVE